MHKARRRGGESTVRRDACTKVGKFLKFSKKTGFPALIPKKELSQPDKADCFQALYEISPRNQRNPQSADQPGALYFCGLAFSVWRGFILPAC
jgi:hypothetical protein